MAIKSSEKIESIELQEFQETVGVARKVGEGSNEVGVASLDTIAKLIQTNMTSTSGKESLTTFKA